MASSDLASDREGARASGRWSNSALEPSLAAQDVRVLAARRSRWLVLIAGLALAGGLLAAVRSHTDNEIGPMIAFAWRSVLWVLLAVDSFPGRRCAA